MNHVLIIGCDLATCKEIKYSLQDDTTDVYYTQSVDEAINLMHRRAFTLVILDACLSHDNGTALIEQIRQMNPLPIFALSETASTADKVAAFKMGADDFLHKPYDLEECLARAQALMRRYIQLNHITERGYALVSHGNLILDTARRRVVVGDKNVDLTRKEYDILLYFIKNRNRILTFEQIYNAVWKEEYLFENSTIFYHVGNLRKKLESDWIESKYGVGYYIHNPSEL